jgi:hypothetical protein
MSISVVFDDKTRTGTVRISDGLDSAGNHVTGMENLLLQLAIDRASANTARVNLMQIQLQDQNDRIAQLNQLMSKLLNAQPSDPAKDGATITLDNLGDLRTLLDSIKDSSGAKLTSYFATINPSNAILASGKSFNDVMTTLKSELNQATNLNQQTMINYQSLINQRNQMTEWVANLMNLLASTISQTTNNLR